MPCEVEFLPVGEGAKAGDAIVVRYGTPDSFWIMIVDGGNLASGDLLVKHIRTHYGPQAIVADVVLTHADLDHASGLRTVLSELDVRGLWLHVPWESASRSRRYFESKAWSDEGLSDAIRKEYDVLSELIAIATTRNIPIHYPFAGSTIGPFRVLSPSRDAYDLLMPQFDRTPAPDRATIEADGLWIAKGDPSFIAKALDALTAKIQKWIPETWGIERLKDGGVTSASNESSVVMYGDFGPGCRVLLTGDAGVWALSSAADAAERLGMSLRDFSFVQIPHHGSRRNLGPTILNRLVGPIQPEGTSSRYSAFVSAPKSDDIHPRKMVINAFVRRGANVVATQGYSKVHWGGFPPRAGYTNAIAMPFFSVVEEYD